MVTSHQGEVRHGVRASVGTHWASGTRSRNVPFDLGAGVVYERTGGPFEPTVGQADGLKTAQGQAPTRIARATAETSTTTPTTRTIDAELASAATAEVPTHAEAWGGYLEASRRLRAQGASRSWVGGRAEVLHDRASDRTSLALTGRLSWEVYGGGSAAGGDSSGSGALFFAGTGTLGLGAYVESGIRHDVSTSNNEFLVTGGLSVRVPAFLLFVLACK